MNQPSAAPDFFIVGAPKAATSSLYRLMVQHPDVFMCRPKEPHFYATDLNLSEVADQVGYDALFADAPDGAITGEASAFYLSSTTAAKNIHAANPDARIIMSVRNPVDAVVSWYHQLRDGFREDQDSFAKAWNLQDARAHGQSLPSYCPEPAQLQYRAIYSYHDQIKRYFDVFGRDAVKVLRFDTIVGEPGRAADDVLEFIGLSAFEVPKSLPATNARRTSKYPALSQFLTSPPAILRPLMGPVKAGLNRLGIKPSVLMMRHFSRPDEKKTTSIDPELRREIVAEFAPEIDRLEVLLDWDLNAWRT